MSYESMEHAKKRADEVKAMMTHPEKWDVKVWKNMGWHWSLQAGAVNLHESRYKDEKPRFHVLMSRRLGGTGGNPDWSLPQGGTHFDDPNEAVKAQVECARVHVDQLVASVEHGESLL